MKPKFEVGQKVYLLNGVQVLCIIEIEHISIFRNRISYECVGGGDFDEKQLFASKNELIDHYIKQLEGMRE